MSLSTEQLLEIARPHCENFRWPSTALDIMQAAIAADRAVRAKPVGEIASINGCPVVFWDKSTPVGSLLYTTPPAAPVVPEKVELEDNES